MSLLRASHVGRLAGPASAGLALLLSACSCAVGFYTVMAERAVGGRVQLDASGPALAAGVVRGSVACEVVLVPRAVTVYADGSETSEPDGEGDDRRIARPAANARLVAVVTIGSDVRRVDLVADSQGKFALSLRPFRAEVLDKEPGIRSIAVFAECVECSGTLVSWSSDSVDVPSAAFHAMQGP